MKEQYKKEEDKKHRRAALDATNPFPESKISPVLRDYALALTYNMDDASLHVVQDKLEKIIGRKLKHRTSDGMTPLWKKRVESTGIAVPSLAVYYTVKKILIDVTEPIGEHAIRAAATKILEQYVDQLERLGFDKDRPEAYDGPKLGQFLDAVTLSIKNDAIIPEFADTDKARSNLHPRPLQGRGDRGNDHRSR